MVSHMALVVKYLPANERDARNTGSIPGPGRSPGEGNDNSLQYSFLGNPIIHLILTAHDVAQTPTFH